MSLDRLKTCRGLSMTFNERINELCAAGVIVTKYGEGIITHVTAIINGVPSIAVVGLKKDCRDIMIEPDDIECIIEVIPFKDRRTLECFKDSISKIEKIMVKCDASEG